MRNLKANATLGVALLGALALLPLPISQADDSPSTPAPAQGPQAAAQGFQVDPSAPVRPARLPRETPAALAQMSPSAAPGHSLLRDDLQPGTVLREWRVPSGTSGVMTRQVGLPTVVPVLDEATAHAVSVHPAAAYPAPGAYRDDESNAPPPPPPPLPENGEAPLPEAPQPYVVPESPYLAPDAPPLLRSQQPGWDPSPIRNGDCSPACAQRRDDGCWPLDCNGCRYGRWDLRAEIGFATINDPEEVLGEPIFGPLSADQFDWDALNYGWALDFRAGVTYAMAPQKRLQARAQWFGSFDDSSAQSGGRFAFMPGPTGTGGVSDPVDGVLDSETELWTAEFNYLSEFSCSGCWRWDLIAGLRLLNLEDDARVDFSPNAGIANFTGPAFITSQTDNFFVGLQAGVAANWDLSPTFVLSGSFKGMVGNITREARVSDQSIFVGGPHSSSNDEDEIVLGAEFELGVLWRLTPRLGITATYTFLMLDGVLRGYDAMDFTRSTSGAVQARQETDQLITHSVFVGLNLNI